MEQCSFQNTFGHETKALENPVTEIGQSLFVVLKHSGKVCLTRFWCGSKTVKQMQCPSSI